MQHDSLLTPANCSICRHSAPSTSAHSGAFPEQQSQRHAYRHAWDTPGAVLPAASGHTPLAPKGLLVPKFCINSSNPTLTTQSTCNPKSCTQRARVYLQGSQSGQGAPFLGQRPAQVVANQGTALREAEHAHQQEQCKLSMTQPELMLRSCPPSSALPKLLGEGREQPSTGTVGCGDGLL
jgi:hypothetical protein